MAGPARAQVPPRDAAEAHFGGEPRDAHAPARRALGLDIGGANLKAATAAGRAWSEPFEIWRAPDQLEARLAALIERAGPVDALAVTMTAELADCYHTKAQGVARIVAAAEAAARGRPLCFWSTKEEFIDARRARQEPMLVAAANWHALATWAARQYAGALDPGVGALLLDVGSTTTDCIPLRSGAVVSAGKTDLERLVAGELVYTGARRTPLCNVAPEVNFRQARVPLAAEWFATMLDAHLLLGWVPENEHDLCTADGRPATVACAHGRLAHCLCADAAEITLEEARGLAVQFAAAQEERIGSAITAVWSRQPVACRLVVACGSGEYLARRIAAQHPATRGADVVALSEAVSPDASAAACAHALALLASQAQAVA
jgi:hypothetical protein